MSRSQRKIAATPAKCNARRRVFAQACSCRAPSIQSAVNSVNATLFCLRCFHPVFPKLPVRSTRKRK